MHVEGGPRLARPALDFIGVSRYLRHGSGYGFIYVARDQFAELILCLLAGAWV